MTRDNLAAIEADLDAALARLTRDIKAAIIVQTFVIVGAVALLIHFLR